MARFLSILFVLCALSSTGQERFFNFVDGWKNNFCLEEDDSYLLWGLGVGDPSPFSHDFTINKLALDGVPLDTLIFEFDQYESTSSRSSSQTIIPKDDNTLIVAGYLGIDIAMSNYSGSLIEYKIAENTYETLTIFQENIFTNLTNIVQSNDSTYLILGRYWDGDTRRSVLYNTDLSGDIRWQNDYYCAFWCDTYPQYILPLSNGNTAVLLREFDDDQPFLMKRERALLVLLDPDGNELWRDYPGDEEGYRIWPGALLEQDGEILVSFTDPYYFDEDDMYQINYESTIHFEQYNQSGDLLFESNLDGLIPNGNSEIDPGVFHSINQMQWLLDGNLIISGHTGVQGIIGKLDSELNLIWYRVYRAVPFDDNPVSQETEIFHVTPTSDGGFLGTGKYQSDPGELYPQGIQTAIALKVDEYGCLEPGCQTVGLEELAPSTSSGSTLKVWPNPTTGQVSVELPFEIRNGGRTTAEVEVVDAYGRAQNIRLDIRGLELATIELEHLPPGAYVLRLITEDGVYSARVIRE